MEKSEAAAFNQVLNPLVSEVPKTPDYFGDISLTNRKFSENIWKRNVDKNRSHNSPSNILWIPDLFQGYLNKYLRSRQLFRVQQAGLG